MRIKLFFLLMLSAQLCFSQRIIGAAVNDPAKLSETEIVDESHLQCVYYHLMYDPDLDKWEDSYEILQVGDSFSKYGSYGSYQLDSLVATMDKQKLTFDQYFTLSLKYKPKLECLIKDLKNGTLRVYDVIVGDNYLYEEPVPAISWTLAEGMEEVCGYLCHKATCTFRGRSWTAWYSDIPLSNGPWKFGNLPGLILKLEDAKGEHKFEAVGFKKDNVSFGYRKASYIKTDREKFNATKEEYKNEAWKLVEGTDLQPKSTDGKPLKLPRRKLFYNPIELE